MINHIYVSGDTSQCTCHINAIYNTTNARLPPYPEPCQLQPKARLRPRLPAHATGSGYAVAAINAATGALEVVSGAGVTHPGLVKHPGHSSISGLSMAACFNRPACFLPGGASTRRRLGLRGEY